MGRQIPSPRFLCSVLTCFMLAGCVRPQTPALPVAYKPVLYYPIATKMDSGDQISGRGGGASEHAPAVDREIRETWADLRRGDYQKAHDRFTSLIAVREKDEAIDPAVLSEVYARRGIASWYLGDLELAISDYSKALALDSANKWALFHRWQAYRKAGDLDRASEDRENGMKIDEQLFRDDYNVDGYGII